MANLRVTDNDLLLYRYLFENDFLTRDQIKNYVWKNLNNSYIDDRLAKLTKENYIKKHPDLTVGTGSVLMAGSGAQTLVKNDSIIEKMLALKSYFFNRKGAILKYRERNGLNLARYDHDRYLSNVRFKIEKRVKSYLSYRMILIHNRNSLKEKKFTQPVPDALYISNDDKIYAIELEKTLKKKSRYQKEIFPGYGADKRIAGVIYVCTSSNILNRINGYLKDGFVKGKYSDFYQKIYLVDYKKLIKSKKEVEPYRFKVLADGSKKITSRLKIG